MAIVDDLRACGLDLSGDQPSAFLRVGGCDVGVRVEETSSGVALRAAPTGSVSVAVEGLDTLTLGAPGDTSFAVVGGALVATRTLARPSLGEAYDAVFDLAKAACRVSRAAADMEALSTLAAGVERSPAADTGTQPVPVVPAGASTPERLEPLTPLAPAAAAPVAAAAAPAAPTWFYVDAPEPLEFGGAASQTLGTLQPGIWYQLLRVDGDWAKVRDDHNVEGWIRASAVHRA